MQFTYLLSSRQQKELMINGRDISIAVPHPPIEIKDPVDWARTVFPTDYRDLIINAEAGQIFVAPPTNRKATPANIEELLGEIFLSPPPGMWCVTHVVVVITLRRSVPRGSPHPIRWPKNVRIDGRDVIQNLGVV